MAGKHVSPGDATGSTLGFAWNPRLTRAYQEGRKAGRTGAVTGTDNTSVAAATMTDSTASFTIDALIGLVITNTATGASAFITDNTATVVTGTLSSGTWSSGNGYSVSGALLAANPHPLEAGVAPPARLAWNSGLFNHGVDDSSTAASQKFETAA